MRFARYDDGGFIGVGVLGDGEPLHEVTPGETIEVLIGVAGSVLCSMPARPPAA